MVEARIHNDGANQDEVRTWQAELLNTFATPSYAMIDPATGDMLAMHEGPEFSADTFAEWLDEAFTAWETR